MTTATTTNIGFEQDSQLVKTLLADLQNEQAALIVADLDTIESMLDKRVSLLQELGSAAKNRYDALAKAGYEANEKGMTAWLNEQSNPMLEKSWAQFQQQLIQAKELNRLNGVLINKHFQRNQEKLAALQVQPSMAQTYGKNGQAQPASAQRTSLSA